MEADLYGLGRITCSAYPDCLQHRPTMIQVILPPLHPLGAPIELLNHLVYTSLRLVPGIDSMCVRTQTNVGGGGGGCWTVKCVYL